MIHYCTTVVYSGFNKVDFITLDEIAIIMDKDKKDNVTTSLLDETLETTPERYPISEFSQFWIVLKRTLLFSRRDWVCPNRNDVDRML